MGSLKFRRASMPWLHRALALLVVSAASLLSSSDQPAFTRHDKAFYAATSLVNFVRPGLVVKITQGSVAQDGTMQLQFTVTDPQGLPLDVLGVTTPGNHRNQLRGRVHPRRADRVHLPDCAPRHRRHRHRQPARRRPRRHPRQHGRRTVHLHLRNQGARRLRPPPDRQLRRLRIARSLRVRSRNQCL